MTSSVLSRWWAWLMLPVVLGGCGSGRPSVGSVEGFAAGVAGALCSWEFKCCAVPELLAESRPYVTEAECRAHVELEVGQVLAPERLAMDQGRQDIDPGAAAACLSRIEARGCNVQVLQNQPQPQATMASIPECAAVFVGRVPVGKACVALTDCMPGSHCAFPSLGITSDPTSGVNQLFGDQTSLVGACVPFQAEGEICNSGADCDAAAGFTCRASDFRCARYGQNGDPCEIDLNNISRPGGTAGLLCDPQADLFCDVGAALNQPIFNPTLPGVCRPMPRAGQPCLSLGALPTSTAQCDPDPDLALQCVGAGFNGTGTCVRPGATGDACGGSGLAACDFGLACVAATSGAIGVCQPAPGQGQPCTSAGVCLNPYVCNPATKVCDMPGTLRKGEPCGANTACASLLCGPASASSSQLVCLSGQVNVSCTGVNGGAGFLGTGGISGGGTGIGGTGIKGPPPPDPGGSAGGAAGSGGVGTGTGTGTAGATGGGGPPLADCASDTGITDDTISSFEDGVATLLPGQGRSGAWFTTGHAGCALSPAGAVGIPGGRCGSVFAIELVGSNCSTSSAVLGADFVAPAGDGTPTPYDLGAYSGVSFWAHVPAGFPPGLRVSLPTVDSDGDPFGATTTVSSGWSHVTVPFSALRQLRDSGGSFDPTKALGIRFETTALGPFDVWIDDVSLVR